MPKEEYDTEQFNLGHSKTKVISANSLSIEDMMRSLDFTRLYYCNDPLPQKMIDDIIDKTTINLLIDYPDLDKVESALHKAGIRRCNSILGTLKEIVLKLKIEMLLRSVGYHQKMDKSVNDISDDSINEHIAKGEQLINVLRFLGARNPSFEKKMNKIEELEEILTVTKSTVITITANIDDKQFISKIYREEEPFKLRVSECKINGQETEDKSRIKYTEVAPALIRIIAYHVANVKPKDVITSENEKYDITIDYNGKKYRSFKNVKYGCNPDLDIIVSLIYFLMTEKKAELDN